MLQHFDFCFKILSLNGLCPGKLVKSFVALNYGLTILVLILWIVQNILDFDIEQLEGLGLISEFLIKQYTVLIKFRDIEDALKDMEHFWPIDLKQSKMLSKYLKIQKIYLGCMVLSLVEIFCKPFASDSTIFGCYFPKGIPFVVTYMFEVYICSMDIMIVAGCNLILCLLIVSTVEQFHALNNTLRSLDLSQVRNGGDLQEYRSIFKNCVVFHNFLLSFVKKLNGILSMPLFIAMCASTFELCFGMYGSSKNVDSTIMKYRIGFIAWYIITEFFVIYGHPAQMMMEEAADIGNALYYDCEWYLPNVVPLRKYILMMVVRSQKASIISGEGFFQINNTTAVILVKTAYSFFTFLQTV